MCQPHSAVHKACTSPYCCYAQRPVNTAVHSMPCCAQRLTSLFVHDALLFILGASASRQSAVSLHKPCRSLCLCPQNSQSPAVSPT